MKLTVTQIPSEHWLRPVRWRLERDFTMIEITVPAGFETDGASVPRLLWWLFSPVGRHMPAAVLHDYLYTGLPGENKRGGYEDRLVADRLFLEAMTLLGIPAWRRRAMYRAVRLFGWASYRKRIR